MTGTRFYTSSAMHVGKELSVATSFNIFFNSMRHLSLLILVRTMRSACMLCVCNTLWSQVNSKYYGVKYSSMIWGGSSFSDEGGGGGGESKIKRAP